MMMHALCQHISQLVLSARSRLLARHILVRTGERCYWWMNYRPSYRIIALWSFRHRLKLTPWSGANCTMMIATIIVVVVVVVHANLTKTLFVCLSQHIHIHTHNIELTNEPHSLIIVLSLSFSLER